MLWAATVSTGIGAWSVEAAICDSIIRQSYQIRLRRPALIESKAVIAGQNRAIDRPEHAYPKFHPGGYSVSMPVEVSETLFSPTTVLWLVVSATAASLLFGSINRRRSRLTETLREYVDRNQDGRQAVRKGGDDQSEV